MQITAVPALGKPIKLQALISVSSETFCSIIVPPKSHAFLCLLTEVHRDHLMVMMGSYGCAIVLDGSMVRIFYVCSTARATTYSRR